jgi:hypothetical protein
MNSKRARLWFSAVSAILVAWGAAFAFFGLGILPVDKEVLLPWESALYGAIMMGWGSTLFLIGRTALQRNDAELMKSLLFGVAVWLVIEALFSARFGVWFNVGVDAGVLMLFSYPLIQRLRSSRR